MRDLFVIIGSLLIAALVAAFAVPRFIDWTPYKGEIEKRIAAATGLELKLVGPIKIELLPRLSLEAEDVTLDTKGMRLSAARLGLELSPTSLLGGDPHIVRAELDNGVVKLPTEASQDPAAVLMGLLPKGDHLLLIDALSLDTVAIELDGAAAPTVMIDHGEANLPAREAPLRLTAKGKFAGLRGRGQLVIAAPRAGGKSHLAIAFDADGGTETRSWRLTFDGEAVKKGMSPVAVDGALVLAQGPRGAPGAAGSPNKDAALWRMQAKAHGELRSLRFDDVEISRERAEALRLSGKAGLDLSDKPRLTLDLSARRLVLDPLIGRTAQGAGGRTAPSIDQAVGALAASLTAALPAALTVEFDIGSESVELAGESFERFRIKGVERADALVISSLDASWVGRGALAFSGSGSPKRGEINGHVEVKAADAAAFLQGLGLPGAAGNPPVPLRLAGNLGFSDGAWRIDALDLSLAVSKITGSLLVKRASGDQQAFIDADLTSRDLDLDAWPLGAVTGIIPAPLAGRLQLHVERLRAGRDIGDLGRLDISLTRDRGETLIEKLKLQGDEGLTVTGSGSIGGAGSSFEGRIVSSKAAPLFALSRLALPQGAVDALAARGGSIEPLSLSLMLRHDAASPNIDASLSGTVAASRLDAKGSLDARFAPISGELSLSAPEARTLLAQLGLTVAPSEPLGRGELEIAVKPDGGAGAAVTAKLVAGKTTLSGDGMLTFVGVPEGRGSFVIATPDLALVTHSLGFAPRLEGDQHFDLSGGWTLSPDALALERLNAHFLGKALTGTLDLTFGAEPRLTGEIQAPVISVPAIAALALGTIRTEAGKGPSASARQAPTWWAASRIPDYAAPPLPISLTIAAPFAELGGAFLGRDAKLTLELGERGIAMTGASASFSGGKLGGEWRIDRDGGLARSILRLTADGVSLADLFPGAGLAGKLSGRLELAGNGETAAQIIAGLGGGGTLRVSDGVLEKADISGLQRSFTRAVADEDLMDKQRLAALVAAETAHGPLAGLRFEAPLIAANGTVKTTVPHFNLASADGADGADGAATLDLKDLSLDARLGLSTMSAGRPEARVPLAASIIWKGPLSGPKREVDAATLLQAVSVERLRLELERIELLEFDQREQAMFNRRLRAFRQAPLPLPRPADQPAAPAQAAPQPTAPKPKANAPRPERGAGSAPVDPPPGAAPAPSASAAPIVLAPEARPGAPVSPP